MSTTRSSAYERAHDAIRKFFDGTDTYPFTSADVAEAVIDVVIPLITEQRQLLGVPDGSVLLDRRNTVYKIRNGYLENILTGWRADKNLVEEQGPLVVVAMP